MKQLSLKRMFQECSTTHKFSLANILALQKGETHAHGDAFYEVDTTAICLGASLSQASINKQAYLHYVS